MVIFLIGCGLGGAIGLCIAAPFLLPWPLRLQCLVNGQMADPMLGLGPPPGLELREMRLIAVSADHGRVDVVVDGIGTGEVPHRATLTRDCCPSSAVARLDGWWSQCTPLLVIADEDDRVHVYGPDGAVTDFTLVGERTH